MVYFCSVAMTFLYQVDTADHRNLEEFFNVDSAMLLAFLKECDPDQQLSTIDDHINLLTQGRTILDIIDAAC